MSICAIDWGFPTPILKRLRDEKFKNPEYIEFLRMQKKMKEKGFV